MKTYVIDIDGTICENKKNQSACYSESAPKLDRIKKINKLFEEGNKIIYLIGSLLSICLKLLIQKKRFTDGGFMFYT